MSINSIGGPRSLELARQLARSPRVSPTSDASAGVAQVATQATETTQPSEGSAFAEALGDLARDVNHSQHVAENAATDFAEGRSDDIHGTMIKLQEADVKLRLLGNVRNRALEAYREIMRMGA